MADTVYQTGAANNPVRVLTALGAGSGAQEVLTLADSAGNLLGTSGAPLPVVNGAGVAMIGTVGPQPAATGTITSPALSASSFTVLASNTARKAATVYNDSANIVYLALAGTASTTSYTVQVPANGGYYELPGTTMVYTGIVTGISLVASGAVRVTEVT